MIYPANSLEKIGFLEIKKKLSKLCVNPLTTELVDHLQVSIQYDEIVKHVQQTDEYKTLIENKQNLQIGNFFDIKSLHGKLRVEGTFLSEQEFFQLLSSLRTLDSICRFFKEKEEICPTLTNLVDTIAIENSIIRSIELVIDDYGLIKDNASNVLLQINQKIQEIESEIRRKIHHVFRQVQKEGWAAESNLTIKDGRFCIPILSEYKRKIKGFIHDESTTGQTVYIEPEDVFYLHNQVRDFEFEKKREIVRILKELTDLVRPLSENFSHFQELFLLIDFIRAKALFAIELDAHCPKIINKPETTFFDARNPLLIMQTSKNKVVPLSVRIDSSSRVLVISGPNAGGKSVAMKTIGLLQVMLQCGLLLPLAPHSQMGIFQNFFIDIGDDQSLESDLSTYSAHLSKMKFFTENANENTLVLIDEFGTGTDPQFGGAMAEAILDALHKKKVKAVVTTHYSNLKTYASNQDGMENAAMVFDNQHMTPLYILDVGKPGSSYTFEIAQKTGINKEIIQQARARVGKQQNKVDNLLNDLEKDKKDIFLEKEALNKQKKELDVLMQENQKLKSFLTENKNALLKNAKMEAQNILKNANRLIENTISEIRDTQAEKTKVQSLRESIKKETLRLTPEIQNFTTPKEPIELKIGDWVKLKDSDVSGKLEHLHKKQATITFGGIKTIVNISKIEKTTRNDAKKTSAKTLTTSHLHINVPTEIDVRGKRTHEALTDVEEYLDKVLRSGLSKMKIIHGKGDGILRKMIREYLKKFDQVHEFQDEHADHGGDGITYVTLK